MSVSTVAAPRLSAIAGWRDALVALIITALVVVAGEAFGAAFGQAVTWLWPDLAAPFSQAAASAVIGLYQVALLWFLAGWWFGHDRSQALGLDSAPVAWWVWPAAIVGLYILKAVVSIAVLMAMHGTGPIGGGPTGGAAGGGALGVAKDAIAPFADLMRSPAWMFMIAGGILAAVVEELLYRGYLSRTLEASRLGFWPGAAIASVVWAGLHVYYPLPMQVMLVVMGLALSWLRMRTGSILPGMAWHIANNTVALVAMRMMA